MDEDGKKVKGVVITRECNLKCGKQEFTDKLCQLQSLKWIYRFVKGLFKKTILS